MRRHMGRSAGLVLLEVATLVAGLAGAFAVEEWRRSREEYRHAQRVLERVAAEIGRNREQIAAVMDYHGQAADALEPLAETIAAGGLVTFTEVRGALPRMFATPILSNTAWDLARSTGVLSVLDLDLVEDLARLYDRQGFLQGKLDAFSTNIYEASNQEPGMLPGLVLATRWLMGDIAINERRLMAAYDEMLATLEEHVDLE